ncbi:MAG: acylphosphatase [Rhodospirillales bacterium]
MKTVRLRISGRVQGVGYRDWTIGTARELGLIGWVRNRADGNVEALASGDQAKIDRFVDACRRGPRLAFVGSLTVEPAEAEPSLNDFSQRPAL